MKTHRDKSAAQLYLIIRLHDIILRFPFCKLQLRSRVLDCFVFVDSLCPRSRILRQKLALSLFTHFCFIVRNPFLSLEMAEEAVYCLTLS